MLTRTKYNKLTQWSVRNANNIGSDFCHQERMLCNSIRLSGSSYYQQHCGFVGSETHFDMTAVATVTPKKAIDRTGTVVSRLEET